MLADSLSSDRLGGQVWLPRNRYMAHFFAKAHFGDEQTLNRLNTVIMFGPIASGLAACVIGALIYDVSRLLSAW